MITYLMLGASVVLGTAKSVLSKKLSSTSAHTDTFALSNACISGVALAVILVFALISGYTGLSAFTVLTGIAFAVCTTAAQFFYMRAFSGGKVSVVTFIYSCGFLLPTLAGTLFWHEPLTGTKCVGTILLLTAFFLCAKKPSQTTADNITYVNRKWVLPAFVAMIMSGMIGILQKIHQSSAYKEQLGVFLAIAFTGSVLLSLLLACIFRRRTAFGSTGLTKTEILISLICGLFIGIANIVNLKLSGMAPAALVFPINNGGVVICSALSGRFLFRERFTSAGLCGIILGILAILVISR